MSYVSKPILFQMADNFDIAKYIYEQEAPDFDNLFEIGVDAKECVKDICDQILEEKENDADLSCFTSSAKPSLWRGLIKVFAIISFKMRIWYAKYEARLIQRAREAQIMTPDWLCFMVTENFQFGDTIRSINGVLQYDEIDESKRIVGQCAVSEVNNANGCRTLVKVKGLDGEALSEEELAALNTYLACIKPAGTTVEAVSLNSDVLKLCAEIIYDGLIPIVEMRQEVEQCINDYLLNLPFGNGVFRRNELIKAICTKTGVIDVNISELCASIAYDNVPAYQEVGQDYLTRSGCLVIDNYFPLSDKITYTPAANC